MRRADALAGGATRHGIDAALGAGRLILVNRGVLAVPGLSEERLEAARLRCRLTCVSAIAAEGLPMVPRTRVLHLAVATRGRAPAGGPARCVHYSHACGRSLAPMPVPIALDHAGRCVSDRAQLAMLDAALRAGRVAGGDLAAWTVTPERRRRWLLAHCDPRAESAQESLARIDLVEAGLSVVPQVYLDGAGRADLLVEGRLALEIDGRAFHEGDDPFTRDRRRDRAVLKGGILTARFTAAEVERAGPGVVAAAVRDMLAAHVGTGRSIVLP